MDNTLNTFAKGMIKDVAETLRPEDSYDDAQDMKLNAGNSASEYIISNVKGNKLSFTIPDTPVLFTVNKNDISLPANWSETIVITTSSLGTFTGSAFTGTASELDDYLDKIQESILEDPIFTSLNLNAARSGQRIRIWSNDITITSIQFAYSNVTVQQSQSNQQIIGWDVSNDVIVLFTTNDSSSTGGIGSLWKLTYDKVSFDTQIQILYSDDINFTTLQPIANPGGVEMVYERPFIHRIYWTDRMNYFRSVNIEDPNLMALDPNLLGVENAVTLKTPYLNRIDTGSGLIAGHYQFSYYLETIAGSVTAYAPTSNSIFITDHIPNSSSSYRDYQGVDPNEPEVLTPVSIQIKIDDIDTSFDYVNIIVIKKIAENVSPVIEVIASRIPIASDTITYLYDGDVEVASITEADFTAIKNTFDICHTIAQKDNILFAANTIGEPFNVQFDTRAYRFNSLQEHDLRNDDGTSISIISQELLQPFELNDTSDAINNDQYVYKYQYNPDANGNPVLGGQGPHISYKFTNRVTHSDDRDVNDWAYPFRLPYPVGPFTESLGTGIDYQRDFYKDHKSPYTNHMFRGYRRGETYRFAWVPVKNGVEGYARWIADIQMPEIYEDIFTSNDPNQETFITGDTDDTYQLGVEFAVNIPPEIADQIDSYRIKRVELEPNQRTVIAQGIIQNTIKQAEERFSTDYRYHPILGDSTYDGVGQITNGFSNFTLNMPVQDIGTNSPILNTRFPNTPYNEAWVNIGGGKLGAQKPIVFHSPEFLFGRPLGYQQGDKIRLVAGLTQARGAIGNKGSQEADKGNYFWKINNLVPLPDDIQNKEINVTDGLYIQKYSLNRSEFLFDNAQYEIINKTRPISGIAAGLNTALESWSDGSSTTYLTLDEHIPLTAEAGYNTGGLLNNSTFSNSGWVQGDPEVDVEKTVLLSLGGTTADYQDRLKVAERPDKILANYIRNVPNQYGGKSYSERSGNVYISTGTEIFIDNQLSSTFKVYGGDTFVNVFDTAKMLKNYDLITLTGQTKALVGLYFPVESFINLDLRNGNTINSLQNLSNVFAGLGTSVPNAEDYGLDVGGEEFKYNYVYSEQMNTQRSFPLPVNLIQDTLIYPTRIWASNVKTYGEQNDSWRVFDYEKYIDIQGDLGEIRQLITHADQLYAWQENGFGIASVNERAVTTDQSGSGIILGKSGVLPRFDYVSEIIGSWHQFSFAVSPMGVLFFDKKDAGLYLFGSQGLRDVSAGKVNSWLHENTRGLILQNDAPIGLIGLVGISSTYDYINKEFLITFFDRQPYDESGNPIFFTVPFTLAYSDVSDVFTSFRSFAPNMYINDNKNIFTPKPFSIPSEVYVHEQGEYGVFYDKDPSTSSITTVVNKEPFITKIFDNIRWFTEVFLPDGTEVSDETFSSIETFNPYQTTGVKTVFKRLMREWKHAIQYQFGTKNRIRSHYVKEKFEFLNNNDKEFRLHYLMNLFRKIMK